MKYKLLTILITVIGTSLSFINSKKVVINKITNEPIKTLK